MIAVEIMFWFAVLAAVSIAVLGKPLAEAYAERIKARYKGIGSEQEAFLRSRVESLEQEVIDLKKQLLQIQETTDFTLKLLEEKKTADPAAQRQLDKS